MITLANGIRIPTMLTLLALVGTAWACGDADPLQPDPGIQAAYGLASPEMHAGKRPFHGNTVGMVVGQVFPAPPERCPPQLPVLFVYMGKGRATHLGEFQVDGSECVFMDPGNPANMASGAGRFTWTAANGDALHVAYDATTLSFQGPGSPWLSWTAPVYITGGTGRFANATLTGVVWEGGANTLTYQTYSSFDGWISYDASDRSIRD
jgi:hypothetical protein